MRPRSQYFTKRSLADAVKVLIGVGTSLVAVVLLRIQFSSDGSETLASQVVVATFALLTLFWAGVWCCRRWPSRRWSIGFVVSCDTGIAVVALHETSWLTGLFALNAFGLIGLATDSFGPMLSGRAMWLEEAARLEPGGREARLVVRARNR